MKYIYILIFIAFTSLSKAQSTIIPIQEGDYSIVDAYYKDTDIIFPKFVGVWKYTNGNESFTITLQEKILYFDEDAQNYIDVLIGEYKYIDNNGVTTVNTLPNLALTTLTPYQNNITGTVIMDKDQPAPTRRIELIFTDPERDYLNRGIRIRHIPTQGSSPEKIELTWTGSMSIIPYENSPTTLRVPEVNYTLIKQ